MRTVRERYDVPPPKEASARIGAREKATTRG
jgi:hypothetical protein